MPCYQTINCSVALENADQELLEKALQEEGYTTGRSASSLTFSKTAGQVNGTYDGTALNIESRPGTVVNTDAIKRSYSKEVVKAKAKKHGFKVEAKPGNKFILSKLANRM